VLRIKLLIGILALVLIGSMTVHADDATTQPTTKEASGKIPSPYSKLTLTDDQKAKITDLHQAANAEIKATEKKEDTDIEALLTDDQKAQLKKMEDDRKAEMKAKRAEKKKAGDSTDKKD
jgi:Spy/CpxP family protein refolding chaperone